MFAVLGTLLSPRVWIAIIASIVVAALCWKSYLSGERHVQKDWDLDRAAQVVETLKASEAARAQEQALTAAKFKVEGDYARSKKTAAMAAAGANAALVRLRDAINIAGSGARSADPATAGGVDGAGAGDVLAACAGAVRDMAAEADRLAGKVTGLQGYVGQVCTPLAKP